MNDLRPFRFWCQKVLPLVYDDELSYYELLCKVVNYLNKVIENINELSENFNELVKMFNTLKNYVDNYFKNLDVQKEINKKLDEMVKDGTFAKVFGNYFLTDNNSTKMMIAPFFISDKYPITYFYKSYDGIAWTKINDISLKGRDYSTCFNNGKLLLTGTPLKQNKITIIETTNLQDYITHEYESLSNIGIYGSEFFKDNDELYLITCYRVGGDKPSNYIYKNCLYKVKDDNIEYLRDINIDINAIDCFIIKKDELYYLFCKGENTIKDTVEGRIYIYTSSDLVTFNYFTYVKVLENLKYEAPSVIYYKGNYLLYVDNYSNDDNETGTGGMHVLVSSDLANWTDNQSIFCNYPTRHGTPTVVNDIAEEQLFNLYGTEKDDRLMYRRLNNNNGYLKLFDIKTGYNNQSYTCIFTLTNGEGKYETTYEITGIGTNYNYNVTNKILNSTGTGLINFVINGFDISVYLNVSNIFNFRPILTNIGVSCNGLVEISKSNKLVNITPNNITSNIYFTGNRNMYDALVKSNFVMAFSGSVYNINNRTYNIQLTMRVSGNTGTTICMSGLPKPQTDVLLYCMDINNFEVKKCVVNTKGDIYITTPDIEQHVYSVVGTYCTN